jgi:hypothetical protein
MGFNRTGLLSGLLKVLATGGISQPCSSSPFSGTVGVLREQSMATVRGKCAACGTQLELAVADTFAAAQLAAALCPACTEQQFLDGGGAILELRHGLEGARFPLGKVTITGGAVEALSDAGEHAATYLARHARGDWGETGHFDRTELTEDERRRGWEATDDPAKINKSNILNRRDQVMSEYTTSRRRRLWVITSLGGGGGTTVLLPEEY